MLPFLWRVKGIDTSTSPRHSGLALIPPSALLTISPPSPLDVYFVSLQAEQEMAEAWTVDPRTVKKTGKLGKGQSGDVHLATDASGRSMALKTVPITLQANDVESLLNQLKELYSSRHPNVTAFYGAAYDDKANQVTVECPPSFWPRRHRYKLSLPCSTALPDIPPLSLMAWETGLLNEWPTDSAVCVLALVLFRF